MQFYVHRFNSPVGRFPRVVTLVGSTRFKAEFERAMRDLTLQGCITLGTGGIYGHQEGMDMDGPVKQGLDELHLRKIDLSTDIYVINKDGYIGASTAREIAYALQAGKVVTYMEPTQTHE